MIYSKEYTVLTTLLVTSFLSYTLSLQLFNKISPSPPSSQKFAILIEGYFLSWIFLVIGTVGVSSLHIGGVYLITTWNLCAWLAATIALAEAVTRAKWPATRGVKPDFDVVEEPEPAPEDPPAGHHFVRGVRYEAPEHRANGEEGPAETEPEETEPTEITPLIQQQRRHSRGGGEYIVGIDNEPLRIDGDGKRGIVQEEFGWWILQMLALVPLPAILLFQIALVLLHSLRNTIADGSPPIVGMFARVNLSSKLHVDILCSVRWPCIALHPHLCQCHALRSSNRPQVVPLVAHRTGHHFDLRVDCVPVRTGSAIEALLPAERGA